MNARVGPGLSKPRGARATPAHRDGRSAERAAFLGRPASAVRGPDYQKWSRPRWTVPTLVATLFAMTTLDAPADIADAVRPLLPLLERAGVAEVRVFAHHRPGEQAYWLAFAYVDGARKVTGTQDLGHLLMAEQAHALVQRLQTWLAENEAVDTSPREAGIAAGMYQVDDQAYARAARRGRRRN